MPPLVLGQASSACAQSSVASTTAQPYPVDSIKSSTPCLLLYLIDRAGKTKEVAKAHMHPVVGLFEGKPIPPLYACVQVEQLLKSSYEDNEIDIQTADGKICLGECVGSTILWHKRDIVLIGPQHLADPVRTLPTPTPEPSSHGPLSPPPREPSPPALLLPPPQESSPPTSLSPPPPREPSPPAPLSPPPREASQQAPLSPPPLEPSPQVPPPAPDPPPMPQLQQLPRVLRSCQNDKEGSKILNRWHAANKKSSENTKKAKSKADSNSSASRRSGYSLPRTDTELNLVVGIDQM
ncbi:hypothetical protein C2845_PM13G07700 [Panicum miliaceum]|uniref:DUF8039 domain-containing protein n=1 Tax=Panicum miliaceum TaxID=4540 RepID=A0A3L6RLI3_PANMI|nr:hypothetical protein C2845_PM13G07700 [Panicum miliaceum]